MITQLVFHCYILLLVLLKPALLFQKINQLPWYQQALRQWLDDLDLPRGAHVLEAGCGTGNLCAYLDQRGLLPLGADYSPEMLSMAKKNYPQLLYQHCDVTDMPFAEGRFQAVICASLINLVTAPQQAVNELYRVCQPLGDVSILVPLQSFTEQQFAVLSAQLTLNGFSLAALNRWHRLAPKKSARSIVQLLQQAGFSKIETRLYLGGMVGAFSAKKPS
ncbi:MAG: hypothetical protein OFPI_11830 [Osedax symbiont Rs2]|nr:MAG: hypothetical protein OFPI_11830 [Osedax symbiont Rs2]